MNEEIKRRTFIASIIGVLVGAPVAVRLLTRKDDSRREAHYFSKTLKTCRKRLEIPIQPITSETSASLKLNLPIGGESRYVSFSPSYLPAEFSLASGDDPDTFVLREGKLFFDRNNAGKESITGGDSKFEICSATGKDERKPNKVTILARDNRLYPGRVRGEQAVFSPDFHFLYLLPLAGKPGKDLTLGTKWKSTNGRIRPYGGYQTEYTVTGFAEILGKKTVEISFRGKVPNLIGLDGISKQKPERGSSMTNEHHGRAWFDLETGLLVRQEVEMDSNCRGMLPGVPRQSEASNASNDLKIKSKQIIQLFDA